MAAQWFYHTGGDWQSGPVDSRELRRLAEAGVVRPDTLVRQGDSGRWVHAEHIRGLFQRSTAPSSSSLGATPPGPPPLPSPVPESGAPSRGVSEKPERVWPVTWAAIIVGSGTVLLLLWALVFRGGSEPQQKAEKDQPPLAVAQSAEPRSSAPAPQAVPQPTKTTPAAAPAAEPKPVPATGNVTILELADLAELVGPSVVQVNVTRPEEAAHGSGFVLDKQGTIVTNFHVIEDATAGRIVFSDRTSAPITGYLGVWPEKDIALVRVECPPEKLHPLRLATSAPRQGERVAAFGSPPGLQQSVSDGIVSAVRGGKELLALCAIDVDALLIQTTTPFSRGNSGGPLVDMKGMVVGVNTLTFRPVGSEDVNFAVAAVELPPLLLAKNETPSPLPARDPTAGGVRWFLRRAAAHMDAGKYDRAIADCNEAIRLDPKSALAYCGRATAYFWKDDYDSAIADYTEAIRLNPKDAGAYFGRSLAYFAKGDDDSAIADYTEAIRVDPKNAFAYYGRGRAYYSKHDYDLAIGDYSEAIRLNPTLALAYFWRGDAYHSKRDYDSSIADYTEAMRLDPKDADAYFGRGHAYFAKGDNDSALADYTEAIRLDPTFALAYSWRGLAYCAKGDDDSAIADCNEAIRLDPKNADAYYFRGMAYQGKGQRAAAETDFAQAKRLGYKP
ncbi:MAG TPA: tetratricopeptide repeat protein [Thermoguttaceae bacterium]|nr:tetratricopeptide repeat protein [Thermoguttaceae bacterium]